MEVVETAARETRFQIELEDCGEKLKAYTVEEKH